MAHLRALFVLFHLVAITLLALPAPVGGMTKKNFADPQIQQTFESWRGVLGALGWQMTAAEFEDLAWRAGTGMIAGRNVVLTPFRPYARWTGAAQGWRMFGTTNRVPARMRIEVKEGDTWRVLWEARSETAAWRRRFFDEGHTRGVMNNWSWLRDKRGYQRFARWLARDVYEELPDAALVRVTMLQRTTPRPAALAADGFPPEERLWVEEIRADQVGR